LAGVAEGSLGAEVGAGKDFAVTIKITSGVVWACAMESGDEDCTQSEGFGQGIHGGRVSGLMAALCGTPSPGGYCAKSSKHMG
jgi:hypothetical protein